MKRSVEAVVARELGLTIVDQYSGGEHRAFAVTTADGVRLVLKVFALTERTRLDRAVAVATRLRERGVPIPEPYRAGTTKTAAYTLQQHCDGEVPGVLNDAQARQLLEIWDKHLGAMPEGRDWPHAVVRALTIGDVQLFADHEPIRAVGGRAGVLLDEIVGVGRGADPSLLRATDAVHGDWHHRNLLVVDDRVQAIIDWESARAGDARYDLVYLNFWTDVFLGSEVAPAAAERIRNAVSARVDPGALRLLAALVALHSLWFTTAYRPERISEVEWIEQHLAPKWRT